MDNPSRSPETNAAPTEPAGPTTLGRLEKLTGGIARGWAFRRDGMAVLLSLRAGDNIVPLSCETFDRADVAAAFGPESLRSGFRTVLPDSARRLLQEAAVREQEVAVFAGEIRLETAPDAFVEELTESFPEPVIAAGYDTETVPGAEDIIAQQPAQQRPTAADGDTLGYVDACGRFIIMGWATRSGQSAPVTLYCNGKPLAATTIRGTRPDVVARDGRRIADAGFTIDLPGNIWRDTPPGGDCLLQIRCDETVLAPVTFTVNRVAVANWIREIVLLPEGPEKQYLQIQALEHLILGQMIELLDPTTRKGLLNFARWLQIDEQLFIPRRGDLAEIEASESLDTLLLWDAMRDLNGRLAKRPESAITEVIATLRDHPLTQLAQDWYTNLAIQLACDSNELDRVREIADFGRLHANALGEDVHALSLAIPVLVSDGRVDFAIDALRRLATLGAGGWLQTSCLHYAIRRVIAAERQGNILPEQAERFREAFIALLETMTSDWFSRLHDLELVDAMIEILIASDQYTDAHRHDTAAAAIRFYGLCPTFWQRLAARDGGIPQEGLIASGYWHWQVCHAALESFSGTPVLSAATASSFDWFINQRTADAASCLREVVLNAMGRAGSADEQRKNVDPAAAVLTQHAPEVHLCLAAFPARHEISAENTPGTLINLVRSRAACDASPQARLQQEAVSLLLDLRTTLLAGQGSTDSTLEKLEQKATLLGEARAKHLGIDFLAAAIALLHSHGQRAQRLLTRLREQLLRAIREAPEQSVLPAPVHTAIARLRAMRDDRLVRAVADEAQLAIERRFPGTLISVSDIFPDTDSATPASAVDTLAAGDWLGDTLVLVPLDEVTATSHRERIRNSWAQDLSRYGIRTLFVRFDDTAEPGLVADTLTLTTTRAQTGTPSDAGRLMQMLGWVYQQLPAAFVMVMPSHGYLSAVRLIESASYRKHHYYGRVIDRSDIDIERITEEGDGRYSLEKSPEESRFVDDGMGLSLSRFALTQLFSSAHKPRGQRLIVDARNSGKMIGDLLAIANIKPSEEDFHCHRRVAPGGGVSIALRDNNFLPGTDTPTLLTLTGDDEDFARIRDAANQHGLHPKKLWPSYLPPQLGRNTNQLELLSGPESLTHMHSAEITVIAAMRNEMLLLPRFLAHYRALGVRSFIVVDNCSDDGTREHLLAQPDVVVYSADTQYRLSHYGVVWQHTVLANHRLGKWVVLADADEFLVYENCEQVRLPEFIKTLTAEGADAALVRMIDMYPFDDLDSADFTRDDPFTAAPWFDREPLVELMFGGGQFSNSRNFVNGLRHRIAPSRINAYVSQKYAMFRYQPWMRISEGVHYTANMQVSNRPAFFAHFKYHAGFKEKVMTEVQRKQHYNGAEEYRRYAAMLTEGSGAFGDAELSTRYINSSSFVAVAVAGDRHLSGNGEAS